MGSDGDEETYENGVRVPSVRRKLVGKVDCGDGHARNGHESPQNNSEDISKGLDLLLGNTTVKKDRSADLSWYLPDMNRLTH